MVPIDLCELTFTTLLVVQHRQENRFTVEFFVIFEYFFISNMSNLYNLMILDVSIVKVIFLAIKIQISFFKSLRFTLFDSLRDKKRADLLESLSSLI